MNIKDNIYYIIRNNIKKYLTGNLGEVVEEDDKLICYVHKNKMKKINKVNIINCIGIKKEDKVMAASYKLDKPIYYVIENIEFGRSVHIYGNDCNVYINNCEFLNGAYINVDGICEIEATDFRNFNSLIIYANDLLLRDLYLTNHFWYYGILKVFLAARNNLEINGCRIGPEKKHIHLNMKAQEQIIINNSSINVDDLNCEARETLYGGRTIINNDIYEEPLNRVLEKK